MHFVAVSRGYDTDCRHLMVLVETPVGTLHSEIDRIHLSIEAQCDHLFYQWVTTTHLLSMIPEKGKKRQEILECEEPYHAHAAKQHGIIFVHFPNRSTVPLGNPI